MSGQHLEARVSAAARDAEPLSIQERRRLQAAYRAVFPQVGRDSKGRVTRGWVEKSAIELYRAEQPDEFYVMSDDWRQPAFRCRGGRMPEFGFEGVTVFPAELAWAMRFMNCDLEGGPYFSRKEWQEAPA